MFHFANNDAFWLNITNLGLGLATLAMLAAVGFSIAQEAVARFRRRSALRSGGASPAWIVHGLGLTMAEGGGKLPPMEQEPAGPGPRKS
jgi:hypothetical protein